MGQAFPSFHSFATNKRGTKKSVSNDNNCGIWIQICIGTELQNPFRDMTLGSNATSLDVKKSVNELCFDSKSPLLLNEIKLRKSVMGKNEFEYFKDKDTVAVIVLEYGSSKSKALVVEVPVRAIVNAFSSLDNNALVSTNIFASNPSDEISWNDFIIDSGLGKNCAIRRGSFGSVIRASWVNRGMPRKEVVIKVLERKITDTFEQYLMDVERVKQEFEILKYAESRIGTNNIVKTYGLVKDQSSKQFQDMIGMTTNTFGIVMRCEEGGNLSDYLHGKDGGIAAKLNLKEKMSIIVGIAEGLSELHSIGIIHGNIKPKNIYLDTISNPKVRLADFGLSTVLEKHIGSSNLSTLRETKHVKGTLTYCAPEMLFNSQNKTSSHVVKVSRKTDIYAFAIMTWEILTQLKPFKDMKTEEELSAFVHNGNRPFLEDLPIETPPRILSLLKKMWAQDRSKRISAVEAFCTFQFTSQLVSKHEFDIYFSHTRTSKVFLSHVYKELSKAGYRVWFDQNDVNLNYDFDLKRSMLEGIMRSKVVLACVNPLYQNKVKCMFELREARKMKKNIIPLVIEGNPFEWANEEMHDIFNFKTKMFVNISEVASAIPWKNEKEGTYEMIEKLKKHLCHCFE